MEPRRSTRTRTASEEVAQPSKMSKMKSISRAKQGEYILLSISYVLIKLGLPIVQESPAKRSSGAFSGTTAQNSVLLSKGIDDTAEKLVDGLGELWERSEQFLNKVLVEPFTKDTVLQTTVKLKSSLRFQKDILQQHSKLKDTMGKYPGTPINAASTNLRIFGHQNVSEGFHRPDNILYRANLAYAIGILMEKIVEGMDDLDSDDMLRLFFATFSRVLKSNEKVVSGSTSCLKATFDLALELQISAFFQMLDDAAEDGEEDFDALKALDLSFYKGMELRGWDIPGLRYKDLTKIQRDTIIDRVNKIHGRLDQNQDLQDLREAFSEPILIYRCFSWARERNIELSRQMERLPDGLLGTLEAIDAEIDHIKSPPKGNNTKTRKNFVQPAFYHPDVSPKVGVSVKGKAPVPMRVQTEISRQGSSEEDSAVTAPAYQTERDTVSTDGNDGFEPALFVGDEGGAEDDRSVVRDTERYEPTEEERMMLSQHVAKKTRQANKENLPHRGLSESDERSIRLNKGKGKRLHGELGAEDDGGNTTDVSRDGDSAFDTQQTPERSNRQRRYINPVPARAGPSRVPTGNLVARGIRDESRVDSVERMSRTQRTEKYNVVNLEAKQRVAEIKSRKPPKERIAWTAEEIECLLEYIEHQSTGWAAIKDLDTENDNILHCRDAVALKDKARNMKLDFLKYLSITHAEHDGANHYRANKPLPPNFEHVPLRKADIEKLKEMGQYDDHTRDDD